MPYEINASSATPRLLILLTDELEESVKVVNRIIDDIIMINWSGEAPKNRCFISVIGYNHNVKELCSGWLKDLETSPLRSETLKKNVPDGAGGIVEVEFKQPVWVVPVANNPIVEDYVNAIDFTKELINEWVKKEKLSPIVLDCSTKCYANNSMEEIKQLKQISSIDGPVLFFGSYSEINNVSHDIFSMMPQIWENSFMRWDLSSIDYSEGLFKREHIFSIIGAMFSRVGAW